MLIWQQRSHVPKFGNWEGEDDVPYTVYFDKARKSRPGSKMINPNDPEENPDLVLQNSSSDDVIPPKPRVSSENQSEKGTVRLAHNDLQKNKEEGDVKHSVNSPARPGGHGVGSADSRRRPSRQSTASSEYSVERSPLHRQAKTPGRDSPSWEGKSTYDSSHGTPGRSRLRPVNRDDEIVSFLFLLSCSITYSLRSFTTDFFFLSVVTYLSISKLYASLTTILSIIPLSIYCKERNMCNKIINSQGYN